MAGLELDETRRANVLAVARLTGSCAALAVDRATTRMTTARTTAPNSAGVEGPRDGRTWRPLQESTVLHRDATSNAARPKSARAFLSQEFCFRETSL